MSIITGGSYDNKVEFEGTRSNLKSNIAGSLTPLTGEFKSHVNISGEVLVTGSLQNLILANSLLNILIRWTSLSGGTSTWNKNLSLIYMNDNALNTNAVDSQLTVIDSSYTGAYLPIKNTTIMLGGSGNGAPSSAGIASKNSIIAKYAAQGKTFACSHN